MESSNNDTVEAVSATHTVQIQAGGRTFEGTPEEFRELRDRLNSIEFCDGGDD